MQTTSTITRRDIIGRRLANQQISTAGFIRPESLVAWLGCVQAQDFGAAKWAVGSRLKPTPDNGNPAIWTDTGIQQAFNEGKILRTHVLRPTWHFVAPADIRWMLAL